MRLAHCLRQAALVCILLGPTCCPAALAAPREQSFHIARRPLADALVALALQSGLSISDTDVDFGRAAGNAVDGRYTPAKALQLLLAETGFGFTFLDDETVRISAPGPSAGRPAGQPASDTTTDVVETIVVTATKRAEIAQQTPASLLIVTGSALRDAGILQPAGLTREVADLAATSIAPGQDKLFIRGLSDGAFSGRSQAVVGLYLDEARLTEDAPDPGLRLVDIDRVEVVRGPQGTLYGAGTLAGLVRVITNQPRLDETSGMIEASGATTQGGAPSEGIDGIVNLGLVPDRLALRAVAYGQQDGGYLNDIRLHRPDANSTGTRGGRAAMLGQISDDWSATLSVVGQRIDQADAQYTLAGLNPLTRVNDEPEPRSDSFRQAALTVTGDLGWALFNSATSVSLRQIADQQDATLAWAQLTGYRQAPSLFTEQRTIQAETQEARLSSIPGGPWSWVTGAYLAARDEDYASRLQGPDDFGQTVTARTLERSDQAFEGAVFGEATSALTSSVFLTGGLRVSADQLTAASTSVNAVDAPVVPASGQNTGADASPHIALSLRPTDTTLLYFSASRGYRPGGININAPVTAIDPRLPLPPADEGQKQGSVFAPDALWSYEIGSKASVFRGLLEVTDAIWMEQWNNVQSDQVLSDGTLYIANVGDIRDIGLEADVTARPVAGLTLRANGYASDPKISRGNPALVAGRSQLPAVPAQSINLSARYDQRLSDMLSGYALADYSYIGRSYLNYDPSAAVPMGAYGTIDLRVGIARKAWQAVLFVDNVTDVRGNALAFGNPFLLGRAGQVTPLRPRTIGLELRRSF